MPSLLIEQVYSLEDALPEGALTFASKLAGLQHAVCNGRLRCTATIVENAWSLHCMLCTVT